MKRYLVYSLAFHILLLSLALFLLQGEKGKSTAPFYARIVTPDELQKEGRPGRQRRPSIAPGRPLQKGKAPKVPAQKNHSRENKAGILPSNRDSIKSHEERHSVSSHEEAPISSKAIPVVPGPTGLPGTPGHEAQDGSHGSAVNKNIRGGVPSSKTLMEKIFDKDIIGKLAHKEKEPPKPDANLTFDTKEFKYYGYMQRLKEKIENVWNYPQDAAERGIYGDLYIQFTIKKDGRIGAIELVRTSGHKNLDDAAIRALRNADPYWPLPDDWGNEGLTITGHFIYSLGGIYLR